MKKEEVVSVKDALSRNREWKVTNSININNEKKRTKDKNKIYKFKKSSFMIAVIFFVGSTNLHAEAQIAGEPSQLIVYFLSRPMHVLCNYAFTHVV